MLDKDLTSLGLSTAEAAARRKQYGENLLPIPRPGLLHFILEVAREPMFILLILATGVYLLLGELAESVALTVFVSLIIIITLYQQVKTENALKALRKLASPQAWVIRDGQAAHINSRELVPGDVVLIYEGDRIPADGLLHSANDLQIDESLLTGESLPVNKSMEAKEVFSGTMVVQGQGIFHVTAIGVHTTIGKIGLELQSLKTEMAPLQEKTKRLIQFLAVIGLSLSFLLTLSLGLKQGDWLKASLAGIALAMSLLPEEFPVILTIFPALGARRLSHHHVLTRRLSAIETLGQTSVLCVDKTGTLTENRMTVTQLWANHQHHTVDYHSAAALPEAYRSLVTFAILASEKQPFDVMEQAFHQLGLRFLAVQYALLSEWHLIHEYDRTPECPAKTHIWQSANEGTFIVASKGAPETILQLCHVDPPTRAAVLAAVQSMAAQGLRVLAVAKGTFSGNDWPKQQEEFPLELIGLVGLSDPLRNGIPSAIAECQAAGIRVMMITGDYPITAKAIAQAAGLPSEHYLTGQDMENLNDQQLRAQLKTLAICARITPEQKLRIIQALKYTGEIVAMTGDGVNDAPALKSAHVGIAMGQRGTDVAREASSLVLLDDNFSSIVNAIKLGRRIFDNIRKSMSYILAIHLPIAGMALLPVLLGLPPFFTPMHLAFLQLIIDPACSIAFENEPAEPNVMRRPPRSANAPLLDRGAIIFAFLQGLGMFIILLAGYFYSLQSLDIPEARAFTFISLVLSNLLLIYSNRFQQHSLFTSLISTNKILLWIVGSTLLFLGSVVYWPILAKLFAFSSLPLNVLGSSILVSILCGIWFEGLRWMRLRINKKVTSY